MSEENLPAIEIPSSQMKPPRPVTGSRREAKARRASGHSLTPFTEFSSSASSGSLHRGSTGSFSSMPSNIASSVYLGTSSPNNSNESPKSMPSRMGSNVTDIVQVSTDISSGRFCQDPPLPPNTYVDEEGGTIQVHYPLGGGAAGDIFLITLTYPREDMSKSPKKEILAMKEVANTKRNNAKREREHYKRHPYHPNIVTYKRHAVAVGARATTHVQVQMDLMNLGSLGQVMRSTEKVMTPFDRLILAVNVGYQIVAGLDYYHHFHRAMHRDVKPDNILLNTEGRVKLCDFDTALGDCLSGKTELGSPLYCAPEMITQPLLLEKYGPQCDMWMVGMTLYEMATGQRPFPGKTVRDLLEAKQKGEKLTIDVDSKTLNSKLSEAVGQATKSKEQWESKLSSATQAVLAAGAVDPNIGPTTDAQKKAALEASHCRKQILLLDDMMKAAGHLEDLINITLVPDPVERATTCQAMVHPFFDSVTRSASENKRRSYEEAIKDAGVPLDGTCKELMEGWRSVCVKCMKCEAYEEKKKKNLSQETKKRKSAGDVMHSPSLPQAGESEPRATSGPSTFMDGVSSMLSPPLCNLAPGVGGAECEDESVGSSLDNSSDASEDPSLGETDPPMFPFSRTKIEDRKALNEMVKNVLFYRQKNARDRLCDFLKEKDFVVKPLIVKPPTCG